MDVGTQLARSHENTIRVGMIFRERAGAALKKFSQRAQESISVDGAAYEQVISLLAGRTTLVEDVRYRGVASQSRGEVASAICFLWREHAHGTSSCRR